MVALVNAPPHLKSGFGFWESLGRATQALQALANMVQTRRHIGMVSLVRVPLVNPLQHFEGYLVFWQRLGVAAEGLQASSYMAQTRTYFRVVLGPISSFGQLQIGLGMGQLQIGPSQPVIDISYRPA